MKKTALVSAILLALAACGTDPDPQPASDDVEQIETRDATDAEINAATAASLDNSIEILRHSNAPNMAVSPASLTYALALAGEGAQCETETEINAFLGVDDDSRASVYTQLTDTVHQDSDRHVTDFQSVIVDNSERNDADEAKLQSVASAYGSDFMSGSPAELNDLLGEWVEEATGGRQTALPSPLPDDMEAVFLTAMRHETEWREEPRPTAYDFTTLGGDTVEVDGYGMVGKHSGWQVDGGVIIRLKTASPHSTYLYYPDEIIDPTELTAADWERDGESVDVLLSVPGIDLETKTDVLEVKDQIGLPHIDDRRPGCGLADYSTVDDTIAIDVVVQNATFRLDQDGIAATAVTEIVGLTGAAPDEREPIIVAVDRPYAMMTVDSQTGWTLMYVTVTDPTADPVQG